MTFHTGIGSRARVPHAGAHLGERLPKGATAAPPSHLGDVVFDPGERLPVGQGLCLHGGAGDG